MRMDRYGEKEREEDIKILSREIKNQEVYKEIYMNTSLVDINNVMNEQSEEETTNEEKQDNYIEEEYIEKSYNINDYLAEAHEKHTSDNAMRNLNNEEFQERENEIKKLLSDIEEKEKENDFFSDLRGDNEDTLIGGKLKTDEFDTSIYSSLMNDDEEVLDHALGDETVVNLQTYEDEKLDHTFEKIIESDRKITKKVKKMPVIVFSITLFMLIGVIIVILVFK